MLYEGSSRMTRVFFLEKALFSSLYLRYLSLWWEASFSKEIHFPGLPLVFLCGIIRLVLAFFIEDFALLGGVAGVFTMERSIQLGIIFLVFLTMLVLFFKLGVLFIPLDVAVLF